MDRGGRSRAKRARSSTSPAASFSCAAAITTTPRATRPSSPGVEQFAGPLVHPQHWPEDLDYAGKRVVVIGSGATAVTLVPAMAETAAHVTMLQRSPTYVVSRPAEDAFANRLRRRLPAKLAYDIVRWRNVLFGMWFFNLARKKPDEIKARHHRHGARSSLAPTTTSRRISRRATIPGTSGSASCPTPTSSRRSERARVEVVTDEIEAFAEGRLAARVGTRPACRHHRHRDRAQDAADERARADRRRRRASIWPRP